MRLFERAGKWYCDIHYLNNAGGTERKRVCTKISVGEGKEKQRSEQKARVVAIRLESTYAIRGETTKKTTSLGECIRLLILDLERKKRAGSTIDIVDQKSEHLFRLFDPKRSIEDITYESLCNYVDTRLTEWVDKKETKHVSRHTIHRELRTLRQAWRVAKKLGKVQSDPPSMPEMGKYYEPKDRVLSQDEVKKLIMAVPSKWTEHLIMYLHTGCSASELEKIRGDGCNFETDMVHVPGTKTEGRDRWIPMTEETRPILLRRKKERRKGLLFDTWTGKQSGLRDACKRADIPPCSPNDLRRTYATEMANAGVPILVLQKLMGHSSGRMLEKVYAQIDAQSKKEAVKHLPQYTKRDRK